MPKFITTTGVVINKQKRKEGDLLTTIFTPNLGKINCIAKGAQSLKSRRLGHLEIGTLIKASLYEKNSYYWLSETESISSFLHTSSSLSQIALLFYFLEIVNTLLPLGQKEPQLYQIIVKAIEAISLNQFSLFIKQEISFLEKLGYGIPKEIIISFENKDYKNTQPLIKRFCESIIEKQLKSSTLFH
ncbi:MAG: repair protein RecO protein [Candidatus Shapirobacteria bacterium GW2011_GWE1_38_10]|uniref:Repair protein RecO protein n=1 Tax=Candidatus Shapirobacteria bacterium GW2011_GWE1_38_10 TaxID=1618488 RepID=A0A0G0IGC9_9BACT|nr:MAG: repair protein RecO protein [Candidatus Shapirobacteria bacterium GW2011_GWF2_37_20]KKQ50080.1 MAG: repair protein RecO protein [Candidatus Shapirobacteria bacterium GW2011_GWE1_38_10]KKQ65271.1 MAG: repair protein RecO protein [Candidatus Shapirobacteria bacterium GW2011_GWF1_38_23]HBP51152.1 DNA repair protein RecO [Candidatus Shapirobacteria bacterium]